MSKDVAKHSNSCSSCQHRRTSHRPSKLHVGYRPVCRPFQCMAIDLVEYKLSSNNSKYVTSVIDHLTRFLVLVAISDKSAATTACVLVERVFSVFSAHGTLHSDMGCELANELVEELQSVSGFKKTRTSAYRPQGNLVLERVHSAMHTMLAMYVNVRYDNWAELFPFIQLAHDTAYNKTLAKPPDFLMFGRRASLAVDVILGVPCTSGCRSGCVLQTGDTGGVRFVWATLEMHWSTVVLPYAHARARPLTELHPCCYTAAFHTWLPSDICR